MSDKKGITREGIGGTLIHYDEKGHKIGTSEPNFWGGYTNYDEKGHKIGTSEEKFFGGGYVNYDLHHNKIGESDENTFGGGYTLKDASNHVVGQWDRSVLDIKSEEEFMRTGYMYGNGMSWAHENTSDDTSSDDWASSRDYSGVVNVIPKDPAEMEKMSAKLKHFRIVAPVTLVLSMLVLILYSLSLLPEMVFMISGSICFFLWYYLFFVHTKLALGLFIFMIIATSLLLMIIQR